MIARPPVVLASSSAHRRALLARLGLAFETCDPGVEEQALAGEMPAALARRLAEAKARAAARRYPGAIVIGCDQVAELDGQALRKPATPQANVAQLLRCSARTVTFHTALCVIGPDARLHHDLVPYRVHFRHLRRAWVEAYVARARPLECAGGFRAEGLGIALFERLEGDDLTALIGLPLIRLSEHLRALGLEVLAAGRPVP